MAKLDPVFVDRLGDDKENAELDIHARLKAVSRTFFNTLRLFVCICTPTTCHRIWMWMGNSGESVLYHQHLDIGRARNHWIFWYWPVVRM